MTHEQVKLLRRLFRAHRFAWREGDGNMAYQEVSWINGINPRTADTLVRLGLAIDEPKPRMADSESRHRHIRLPLPLPSDTESHAQWIDDQIKDQFKE